MIAGEHMTAAVATAFLAIFAVTFLIGLAVAHLATQDPKKDRHER